MGFRVSATSPTPPTRRAPHRACASRAAPTAPPAPRADPPAAAATPPCVRRRRSSSLQGADVPERGRPVAGEAVAAVVDVHDRVGLGHDLDLALAEAERTELAGDLHLALGVQGAAGVDREPVAVPAEAEQGAFGAGEPVAVLDEGVVPVDRDGAHLR